MLRLREAKNSRKQGNIGLGCAIKWLWEQNYGIYIPLAESEDIDLVAEIDGKLCGIQVKTTYHKSPDGIYMVNLLVSGGNRSGTGKVKHFDPSKVDYLFAVTDEGKMYFIPSRVIEARSFFSLGEKYALYQVE